MGIWEHKDSMRSIEFAKEHNLATKCFFCKSDLEELIDSWDRPTGKDYPGSMVGDTCNASVCPVCGWWTIRKCSMDSFSEYLSYSKRAATATLKNLDISDQSTPIEDVKSFLTAKYEARKIVDPRLFEETVASVFGQLGYNARVTAKTKDGGIDVILDGPSNTIIGVQVKRSKNFITVSQIRELVGALMLGGIYTEGIFVTTSDYTSYAKDAAKKSTDNILPVKLYDAENFLSALHASQRNKYQSKQELLETLQNLNLHDIDKRTFDKK